MSSVELLVILLVVTAALAWLAHRVRVPYPIFLTLAGLGIGVLGMRLGPNAPTVRLHPDVVFLIFLPPLLYHAGLLTSWRDFRANLRPISFLAIGLVLFTTVAVAAVAHYAIGMRWDAAFVLGAIVSPPDAIAATAITRRLRVPRRVVTILEGESLVNDASALIAYRFAVAAVVAGEFSLGRAAGAFVMTAVGGVCVGYAVGRAFVWLRPRLHDPAVEGVAALLIAYVAYLPAEWLHASGVLAAVTAGVYVGRRVPQITGSSTRLRLYAVWDTLEFVLNGLVFILIGLQIPEVVRGLGGYSWPALIGYSAAVSAAAIVVRLLWVFPATYMTRLLPVIRRHDPTPAFGPVFLIAWVGLRGIVSLAAALALPTVLEDGVTPFPHRDLIVFLTFAVILATLVGQGLTLPWVIRRLDLPADHVGEQEEELARLETTNAALARLHVLSFTGEIADDVIERARVPYEQRLQYYGPRRRGIRSDGGDAICRSDAQVARVAIGAEREMLVRLRDEGAIGDDTLRRIQTELDLQEARLGSDEEE
ncbi:MAG: Na+/H+ antiporter [Phycisphaerales bacterium]|nr:Na+/H+ antiporter [Phycisphaerales bacterium]